MATQHIDTTNLKTTGFNSKTKDNMVIDAGAVIKDFGLVTQKVIGATSGGNKFQAKTTYRQPKIDGLKSKFAKGLEQVEDYDITLECNFLEMSEDMFKMAMNGDVDKDSYDNYNLLSSKMKIVDSDYVSNIALVGVVSGSDKPIIIVLENTLVLSGVEVDLKDSSDNVLKVTFTAHFDPENPNIVPYHILYPKPNFVVESAKVDSGKILLQMSDDVKVVPKDGFTVTVAGTADVITTSSIGTDTTKIELTLTTLITNGQAVTVAYAKPTDTATQVVSENNIALDTFTAINVVNSL